MSNGWDDADVALGKGAANVEASDPVSDFNFGGRTAPNTESPFASADAPVDVDVVQPGGEDDAPAPRKKKGVGIFFAMGAVVLTFLGAAYFAVAPFVPLILGSAPEPAQQARGSALALEAVSAKPSVSEPTAPSPDAAAAAPAAPGGITPITTGTGEPPTLAAAAISPEPPQASPQLTQAAQADAAALAQPAPGSAAAAPAPAQAPSPTAVAVAPPAAASLAPPGAGPLVVQTPPATSAMVAAAPAAPTTSAAVAEVLANAQRVDPTPAPSSAGAERKPTGGSKKTAEAQQKKPVDKAPPAATRRHASAPRSVTQPRARPVARSESTASRRQAERRPSAEPTEQVMGYTLLAIHPRTGDFQQAWVRDSKGQLRIVSAGDRVGSLAILKVDGKRGEVHTAAGVIRHGTQ